MKVNIALLFLYTCCWSSVGDIRREAGIDKRNMLRRMNEQSYGHPGLGHPVPRSTRNAGWSVIRQCRQPLEISRRGT